MLYSVRSSLPRSHRSLSVRNRSYIHFDPEGGDGSDDGGDDIVLPEPLDRAAPAGR